MQAVNSARVRPSSRAALARPAAARAPCVRVRAAVNVEQLKAAKEELKTYIASKNCNPIVIRLGWHDAGTYDKNVATFPDRGGATGSIRFKEETAHGANAGLQIAVNLLKPIQKKFPEVSYADLYQLASAVAIEVAGGPKVPMRYGRKDADVPMKEGNLPGAAHPFADGSDSPGAHLKRIFYRMGLNDQEIVALSGAHTLGRVYPDRSGFGKEATDYTKDGVPPNKSGPGHKGGQSWTSDWLSFNNSYFQEVKAKRDAQLVILPTDAALFEDDAFKPYAEKYAADEAAFFADYALAHAKLSELGAEWVEGAPVTID